MLKFREYALSDRERSCVPEGGTYVVEAIAPNRSVLFLCQGYEGWFYITVETAEKHSNDLLRSFWQHIPDITKKEDAIEFVKVLFRMGEV